VTRVESFGKKGDSSQSRHLSHKFENSPMMEDFFLPLDMVSGPYVISLAWCVVLNLFLI